MGDIINLINTYGIKSIWWVCLAFLIFYLGKNIVQKLAKFFLTIPSSKDFHEFQEKFNTFTSEVKERNVIKDASELRMAENIGAMKSDIDTLKQGINTINAVLMGKAINNIT